MRMVIRPVVYACVAAVVVFAAVQDRVTGAGVGQYLLAQRDARTGTRAPVTIDEVMKPAVRRGVQQGALWGGGVLVTGLACSLAARRRRSGE